MNRTTGQRRDTSGILLLGDPERVFDDCSALGAAGIVAAVDPVEGVALAGRENFEIVALVLDDRRERVAELLVDLRRSGPTKLLLLARMAEEPLARRLVIGGSEEAAADAYLIYPMPIRRLREQLAAKESASPSQPPASGLLRRLNERVKQLEKLATEDDLTGLKNRRYIWEFAKQILERARAEEGRVTLLVYDIDDFKHYNDVYGHPVGDRVLKEAALLMSSCCRAHDIVGRIGGDEFAVVFWEDTISKQRALETERRATGATHPREAIFIAQRFRKALEASELHLLGPGGRGVLTISGGLASFPRDGVSIDQLFERADAALMEAKRSGKNRIYLVGSPQTDIDALGE